MKTSSYFYILVTSLLSSSLAQADCKFFEHINYGGASYTLGSGQIQSFVGNAWNDRISSIQVTDQCTVTAYQHINFGGDARTFTSNASFVGNLWNDQISALRCQCPTPPKPVCTLYEHINFQGATKRFYGDMSWIGDSWNDKVSSVNVPQGCSLTIYQHINYGGDNRVFGAGQYPSLGNLWNDQMSSGRCTCQ